MCKVLRIAHYEYYYQRKKKENRYKEANEKLDKEILKEYENSKGGYGSPKIQKALEKRGTSWKDRSCQQGSGKDER